MARQDDVSATALGWWAVPLAGLRIIDYMDVEARHALQHITEEATA
jgi:hypothetical protein